MSVYLYARVISKITGTDCLTVLEHFSMAFRTVNVYIFCSRKLDEWVLKKGPLLNVFLIVLQKILITPSKLI